MDHENFFNLALHDGSQSTQVRYHIKYLYLLVQETYKQVKLGHLCKHDSLGDSHEYGETKTHRLEKYTQFCRNNLFQVQYLLNMIR